MSYWIPSKACCSRACCPWGHPCQLEVTGLLRKSCLVDRCAQSCSGARQGSELLASEQEQIARWVLCCSPSHFRVKLICLVQIQYVSASSWQPYYPYCIRFSYFVDRVTCHFCASRDTYPFGSSSWGCQQHLQALSGTPVFPASTGDLLHYQKPTVSETCSCTKPASFVDCFKYFFVFGLYPQRGVVRLRVCVGQTPDKNKRQENTLTGKLCSEPCIAGDGISHHLNAAAQRH